MEYAVSISLKSLRSLQEFLNSYSISFLFHQTHPDGISQLGNFFTGKETQYLLG